MQQPLATTAVANVEFKMYPKRYLIVFLFSLAQMMTSVLINTLTPIAKYLETIYGEDPLVVNSGALLFALMHPLFTFPAAYVIDTYGTKMGIRVGCILCLIGTALRLLVNESFAWVIVGQVVAGIGRPFILNCQAKISANWFTAQKRGGITQLLTLILNVSLIIGIFIPGLLFGGYKIQDPPTDDNLTVGRRHTFNLMLVQTIMAIICYLPNMFFQESLPPTPASESGSAKRQPFKIAVKKLLSNRNYLLLLIAFGCYFGIFNALSIILSYLLTPWFADQLPLAVGYVGGSPVISGIIGVIIIGPMQRKSKKFKKFILICMIGSCSAMLLFYPLLETEILALVSLVSAYNSFFLIPLVPIMLQLACESAFPVGQGFAAGLLFAMGNFAGFLLGLILSLIVRGRSAGQSLGGLGFCLGIFLIGLLLVFLMKQELNRSNYEQMTLQQRSNADEQSQLETVESAKQKLLLK